MLSVSPSILENENHTKRAIRNVARHIVDKKWQFKKCLSCCQTVDASAANDKGSADRLRQALYHDPDALQALYDMFASAVTKLMLDGDDDDQPEFTSIHRILSLTTVTEVHSFDALKARVATNTGDDLSLPDLIVYLLTKVDGGGGGDEDGLNFRTAVLPSCVAAALGPGLPENSFTFAMGPRRDDSDDGCGEGLFVYVPVIGSMGAYGALVQWPSPPLVGASEDLHVALAMAGWTNSCSDTNLFGGGRYRSVVVCHALRSDFDSQLPYEIGPPRYLVVCVEQPLRRKRQLGGGTTNALHGKPATEDASVRLYRLWQPLTLGAILLVGGYMAYRYVRPSPYHWSTALFELFAPMRRNTKQ